MKPTPTTGTTLETLLLYASATYQLRETGRRCYIAGFDFRTDYPVQIVCRNEEEEVEGLSVTPCELLPVLYSFEDLINPLPSGEIPAVEVAKLLTGTEEDEYSYTISQSEFGDGPAVAIDFHGEFVYVLSFRPDWTWFISDLLAQANHEEIEVKRPASIIDYLRRHDFAIGLAAHQYVRKTAP